MLFLYTPRKKDWWKEGTSRGMGSTLQDWKEGKIGKEWEGVRRWGRRIKEDGEKKWGEGGKGKITIETVIYKYVCKDRFGFTHCEIFSYSVMENKDLCVNLFRL